jgi:hypothetical protein
MPVRRVPACKRAGAVVAAVAAPARVQNIVFIAQYFLLKTIINNNLKQYCIILNNIKSKKQ